MTIIKQYKKFMIFVYFAKIYLYVTSSNADLGDAN